jgi:type II secretory pathway component GspD/PulD (secretin)
MTSAPAGQANDRKVAADGCCLQEPAPIITLERIKGNSLSHKDHTMLRTLLLSVALGLTICLTALADDPVKPDAKSEKPPTIEVYKVKHAELGDAQQAFTMLAGKTRAPLRRGTGPGVTGKGGPATRPVPDDAGSDPETAVVPAAATVARALGDPRTRSLIVRGTEKDQQLAADLVAVLDTPEGKALPEVKALKAFRLQHLDPNDLTNILLQLDPRMTYRLAPIGRMKLLLATGTEEQMKELADAVKKLDVPGESK